MNWSMLTIAMMFCLASIPFTVESQMSTQPTTLPSVLRLPEMPLHDPYIVAHEPTKTYYLYTTNSPRMTGETAAGTMAYRSRDLLNWDKPIVVFKIPENTWADASQRPWAPEVHEYHGKFYLFTTLHNPSKIIKQPPDSLRVQQMRSTVIAVADSPEGPFEIIKKDSPIAPESFMTLDGTLYVDDQQIPWMVYAHEWVQKSDGTMEAVRLKPDLSDADGEPIHLFKASDAPWLNASLKPADSDINYVTDGPQFFRTRTGALLMLWSSYESGSYVQTHARSRSGTLNGPWEQLDPLVKQDSGHGMLFRTFEGQLMMILHRPFKNARGKLYEMEDAGDHLRVIRQRTDLDGDE